MVLELGLVEETLVVVEYSLVVVDDVVDEDSLTVEDCVDDSAVVDSVTVEDEDSVLVVKLVVMELIVELAGELVVL